MLNKSTLFIIRTKILFSECCSITEFKPLESQLINSKTKRGFILCAGCALPPKFEFGDFSTWRRKKFFRHRLHSNQSSWYIFLSAHSITMEFWLLDWKMIHVPASRRNSSQTLYSSRQAIRHLQLRNPTGCFVVVEDWLESRWIVNEWARNFYWWQMKSCSEEGNLTFNPFTSVRVHSSLSKSCWNDVVARLICLIHLLPKVEDGTCKISFQICFIPIYIKSRS